MRRPADPQAWSGSRCETEGPELSLSFRSTATWPLDPSKEEKQGWRHIRIKQMGKNASGQTHYLSLSGLELYGTITAVCEDQLGTEPSAPCPHVPLQALNASAPCPLR